MKKIILASQSPWRKKLLSWLDVPFEVVVSEFDEKSVKIADPEELVKTLAEKKAETVVKSVDDVLVIGADTVISINNDQFSISNEKGEILGKPRDIKHAREILKRLRGNTHSVYTGVAVIDSKTGKKIVESEVTKVVFKDFSDDDLEKFLYTGESIGKAGAYQFLKVYDNFIDSYEGSVTGVIGLPLKRLSVILNKFGVGGGDSIERKVMEKIGFED